MQGSVLLIIFMFHGLIFELAKLKGMKGEACIAVVLTVTILVSLVVNFTLREIRSKLKMRI